MKALENKKRLYKSMLDASKNLGAEDLKSRYGKKPMAEDVIQESAEVDSMDDGTEGESEENDEKVGGKMGGKTIVIHIGR